MWWVKLPDAFGHNTRREGKNFLYLCLMSLVTIWDRHPRWHSEVLSVGCICSFYHLSLFFSAVFINSGHQIESLIWKIVQPSAPMFILSQSASQNSVCTVWDSAFAHQNNQLGHRIENVDVQTLLWAVQHCTHKNNWCYLKDHSSVFKVLILASYHALCLTSLNETW